VYQSIHSSHRYAGARRLRGYGMLVLAVCLLALGASGAWAQGTGYWHTSGNKILDANGTEVRIAGINWYGFETTDFVIHGLPTQDYHTVLNTIKALGYNVIRMPFSNQLVESNPVPTDYGASNSNGFINTDLVGETSLQIMDKIIQNAGNIGLRVILDNHRSEAGNSNEANGLWYTSAYPQANWIADWQTMVTRYSSFKDPQGDPVVIGVDLRNEPHLLIGSISSGACWTGDTATNGAYTGCPTSNTAQNWPVAAAAAGNAVLAINPKLLVFVEGIDCYDGSCDWQGGNLAGVATNPVTLNVANQVVYSPHDYGPNLYRQPWFTTTTTDASLDAIWAKYWGYINTAGTAPVWVGEFGTDNTTSDIESTVAGSQGQWFQGLTSYIAANPTLNWTYWALDGEDDYGLLDSGYDPTPLSATKQSLLAVMQFPLTGGGGLACPVPALVPQNFAGTPVSSSQVNLSWTAVAQPVAGCTVTYNIFRSTTGGFTASSTNQIATGVTGTTYADTGLTGSTQYYYVSKSVDVTGTTQASSQIGVETLAGSSSGFTLAPSSPSLSITQGKTATDTITVTDAGGFTGSVTLAATGLPSGVTGVWGTNPTTGSSVLTLTATTTATTGAFTITVTGTSGSTTAHTTFVLNVSTSAAGFTLAPSAAALSVTQGKTATDTVTVTDVNGFTGSVTLTATGLPSGVTVAYGTNPTTATSVLTFTASATATVGTSTVTITGTSGTTTATTTIALTVASSTPSTCTVDYVISPQNSSAFGAAITIVNGSTAVTSWTLTWTFANGQTISSLWNGIETQSGTAVTVKNEPYNGSIAAGGTLTGIGFNGTWNGTTNAIPTAISLNGTVCTVN